MVGELREGKSLPTSSFAFLVIKNDSIVAWNDHHFIPPVHHLLEDFEIKFLKENAGELLVQKWKIDESSFLIAILPLHVQYKISNNYLH